MTIKTRENQLKNNQVSVTLDIHQQGGKRKTLVLPIRYCSNPKTPKERQDRKEKKEEVLLLVAKMKNDALIAENIIERKHYLGKDFFEYCEEFLVTKNETQTKNYLSAIKQLKSFVKNRELSCSEIDRDFLLRFRKYLDTRLTGISPYNYFKQIKKIIKEATYKKYFIGNPTERIVNKKGIAKEKEVLSSDEIKILSATDSSRINIKNAFLFSYLTGLRFSDVAKLKWAEVKDNHIDIIQQKTKERLTLILHPDIAHLIGTRKKPEDLVFKLPSHLACLIHLKKWVSSAGIEKHITWHCSRHSFATALVLNNENLMTVSKLLGHKSIIETQRYVRVAERTKETAINSIPSIL
jgi:integrase/recombinase XerD